jgi:catechol 2,3-dioxygenase-like lactoylglutathione lyase family enzyme
MGSPVIDHVVLLVSDRDASRRFYEATLAPLGFHVLYESHDGAAFGVDGVDDFGIYQNERPSRAAHVAFVATSRAAVDAFYDSALSAGGRDNGSPRIWSQYHAGYYAAFVFDPDGNNIEAVFHDRSAGGQP